METLLQKPKLETLLQTGIDDLHHDTMDWLNELEFCTTELSFLNKLLDKYFLRIKGSQQITDLSKLDTKVNAFRNKTLNVLYQEINSHEKHLAELEERRFIQDEQSIREEHKKFGSDVKAFMADVKKIKKEIFDFVEKELKSTAVNRKK